MKEEHNEICHPIVDDCQIVHFGFGVLALQSHLNKEIHGSGNLCLYRVKSPVSNYSEDVGEGENIYEMPFTQLCFSDVRVVDNLIGELQHLKYMMLEG